MANRCKITAKMTVTEDITLGGLGTDQVSTHEIDNAVIYTDGGTVDHDKVWSDDGRTVSEGDIDLTSLTDSKGDALDLTGKKVKAIAIQCAAGNSTATTFQEHATNGYGIFGLGTSVILAPGGKITASFEDGNEAVAADAKVIDVNGTSGDAFDIIISAGD